jgi:hypothetical protein
MVATQKGQRWTAEADAELIARSARGELLPDMARAMGRTQEALRTRANMLGVPVRSSLRRTVSVK